MSTFRVVLDRGLLVLYQWRFCPKPTAGLSFIDRTAPHRVLLLGDGRESGRKVSSSDAACKASLANRWPRWVLYYGGARIERPQYCVQRLLCRKVWPGICQWNSRKAFQDSHTVIRGFRSLCLSLRLAAGTAIKRDYRKF